LQEIIYRAMERDPENRYAHAREFSQDLRHQDQVGVAADRPIPHTFSSRDSQTQIRTSCGRAILPADRLELKDWRERKSGWPRRILNYAALALIPIVIFTLLLWVTNGHDSGRF
jgi:eukaryotic-like serine/threonine-protein kinase